MKRLSAILILLSALTWFVLQQPLREEWQITLFEWNQRLPAPMWIIGFILGFGTLFLSIIQKSPKAAVIKNPSVYKITPSLQAEPLKSGPNQEKSSHTMGEDWREQIEESLQALEFPRGGKILVDPQKDLPFTLRLPHKTHQAYKDSIDRFAQWTFSIPTPKRVAIRFEARCSEVEHNLVRAAFRKRFHITDMMIRKDSNRAEILFHHPDAKWKKNLNFRKIFPDKEL